MGETPENIVPITPHARSAAEKFGTEHDRELLTILFTDLVDSTKLQSELGNVEAARLTELHRKIVRDELAKYDAREIEWAGDSCLAVFSKPSDAVVFALRMQAEHRRVREAEPKLATVRVGMHLGEIVVKKRTDGGKKSEDLFGLQVSEAARVMSVARGNQIFCTRAVFDNARGSLKGSAIEGVGDVIWVNYGAYMLKGSEDSIELCEVGSSEVAVLKAPQPSDKVSPLLPEGAMTYHPLAPGPTKRATTRPGVPTWAFGVVVMALMGVIVYLFLGRPPASGISNATGAPIRSLAVLPLDNLMNDPEQDYFVDGMTEAITAELSKIASLKVISRTSAMHYKDTELSMPEIAAELGVMGLIEGSVLRQGNEVKITVQLIDGPADTHLWANSYEGTLDDIFRLHSDVALAIADEIRVAVSPDEQSRIAQAQKVDPGAYDLYLRGLETYFDGSVAGPMRAIRYFEDALEIEPDFALAWSHKSLAHIAIGLFMPPALAVQNRLAEEAANMAIALAPDDAGAYFSKHNTELFSLDWYAAKATADRAYELNPNLAEISMALGQSEACRGDFAEAEKHFERAYALDSRSTFIVPVTGLWLASIGRQARGIQILERFVADNPDFALGQIFFFFVLSGGERYDEAFEALDRFDRLSGTASFSNVPRSIALAQSGRLEEARALESEFLSAGTLSAMPLPVVAYYYASVGNFDTCFDNIERAMESPNVLLVDLLRLSPFSPGWTYRSMRKLPDYDRYWEIIDRMNFPPYPPGHPGHEKQQAWLRIKAAEAAEAALPKPVRRLSIPLAPGETLKLSLIRDYSVAVSPDGSHVAYIGIRDGIGRLMIRPMDQAFPMELPGTEGASHPTFSPDGNRFAFSRAVFSSGPRFTEACPRASNPLPAPWAHVGQATAPSFTAPTSKRDCRGFSSTPATPNDSWKFLLRRAYMACRTCSPGARACSSWPVRGRQCRPRPWNFSCSRPKSGAC